MSRDGALIRELTELLGEEGLFRLVHAYGGFRLYFPAKLREDGDIAQELGFEIAKKLHERYSPDLIRIPLCRDLRVKMLLRQGRSVRSIARMLGMTETGMEKLLHRLRNDGVDEAFLAKNEIDA